MSCVSEVFSLSVMKRSKVSSKDEGDEPFTNSSEGEVVRKLRYVIHSSNESDLENGSAADVGEGGL